MARLFPVLIAGMLAIVVTGCTAAEPSLEKAADACAFRMNDDLGVYMMDKTASGTFQPVSNITTYRAYLADLDKYKTDPNQPDSFADFTDEQVQDMILTQPVWQGYVFLEGNSVQVFGDDTTKSLGFWKTGCEVWARPDFAYNKDWVPSGR